MKLHWQIAIALALAVTVGSLVEPDSKVIATCGFVGVLFLNGLKMVVIPLIASSIIHALMTLGGDEGALRRMGVKAMTYYLGTSLLAVLTGLAMINLLHPGIIDGVPAAKLLGLTEAGARGAEAGVGQGKLGDVAKVFERMIPANPIEAASTTNLLGIVFFSLIYGFCAARLPAAFADTQRAFWGGVRETMMGITGLVMKTAPLGVFALVAKAYSNTGLEAAKPLLVFFVAVLGGLAFHLFVTMSLVVWAAARASPLKMLQAMTPALLTAFSTSTSAGTLPVTLDCLRTRVGVSERVTAFTLPLGAAINLDGSALYECAVAMFFAQAYGLHLDLATQFVIVWMALITSMGVTGIPSASLVAITIILAAIGLPVEGIGVIFAVDRLLDMCRTAVNVYGDACGSLVVARLEGETGMLKAPL
ncbi:MAG: dicarboxylate/amino acid:cation symporter [Nevskia sp.]